MTNLACPEHVSQMDIMHNATPPTRRPPLPRLDIPGAPCGTHVPAGNGHMVCHLVFCLPSQTAVHVPLAVSVSGS